MLSKAVKVSLEEATHEQMILFASTLGIETPANAVRDNAKSREALREVLKAAGYTGGLVMIQEQMQLPGGPKPIPDAGHAFDPDNERWAFFTLQSPDEGSDRPTKRSPAFVGVNSDTLYVPYNRRVICRELMYVHLAEAVEKQWKQKRDEMGNETKGLEPFYVARYPHSFHGYVGYVNDGDPDIMKDPEKSKGIHFVRPGENRHVQVPEPKAA